MKLQNFLILFLTLFLFSQSLFAKGLGWDTQLYPGDYVCIVDISPKDRKYWAYYMEWTDPKTERKSVLMREKTQKTKYLIIESGIKLQPPHRIEDGWWSAKLIPGKHSVKKVPSYYPVQLTHVRLKKCGANKWTKWARF